MLLVLFLRARLQVFQFDIRYIRIKSMDQKLLETRSSKAKGRGIYAKTFISKGTTILSLEEKNFISFSLFSEHPCFLLISNSTTLKVVQFALFLVYSEKNPTKEELYFQVQKYQANLPRCYHNLICWNDQQLQNLDSQALIDSIRVKKNKIKSAFEELRSVMKKELESIRSRSPIFESKGLKTIKRGPRHFTGKRQDPLSKQRERALEVMLTISLEEIVKYVAVVESRNAYYPNEHDIGSIVGALVSELELFNHSRHQKCRVYCQNGCYKVVVTEDIEKGKEVCVSYGSFSNQHFLQFYGMIPASEDEADSIESTQAVLKQLSKEEIDFQRKELALSYNQQKSQSNVKYQEDNR